MPWAGRLRTTIDGQTRSGVAKRVVLTVAPNPYRGICSVRGLAPSSALTVSDITGCVVLTARTGATGLALLDLRNSPAGVYMVRTGSGTTATIARLVKN